MKNEYLTQLHGIINHYDVFQKIAVPLKWAETEASFCDASQYWREVYLRFYKVRFPKGYLKEHFSEAFVQTILTVMAYTEEWDLDFWAEMPQNERLDDLTKGEAFYSDYFYFQRLCMEQMTAEELIKDVRSWFPWAETEEEMKKPRAHILPDEAKKMLCEFAQADGIWLGGSDSCAPDENWLAVCDDAFLYVSFHCSG